MRLLVLALVLSLGLGNVLQLTYLPVQVGNVMLVYHQRMFPLGQQCHLLQLGVGVGDTLSPASSLYLSLKILHSAQ